MPTWNGSLRELQFGNNILDILFSLWYKKPRFFDVGDKLRNDKGRIHFWVTRVEIILGDKIRKYIKKKKI